MDSIKNWLNRYGELQKGIDLSIERLEALQAKASATNAPAWDDMPSHASGARKSKVETNVSLIADLEKTIREQIEAADSYGKKIDAALWTIKGKNAPLLRAVLQCRYLDGLSWNETNSILFGRLEDFELREDSYLRRTHLLHAKALDLLAELVRRKEIHIF